MSVSFQAASSVSGSAVTSATIASFNVSTGANRAICVGLGFDGVPTSVAVKYGATSLSQVAGSVTTSASNLSHTEMWALANPTTTASNIVATWTTALDMVMGVVAANGVDQTTPCIHGTSATANTSVTTVTINSAVGDMTMDTAFNQGDAISTASQTQRFLNNIQTFAKCGGSTGNGAATVTHTWHIAAVDTWSVAGCDFLAAGGATAPTRLRFPTPLTGVGSGNMFFGNRVLKTYVLG